MALSAFTFRAVAVFAFFGMLAGGLSAKPKSSLSDSEIEAAEAKVAFDKVAEENVQLREKLAVLEAESAKMTESLANSESEAEVFRRESAQLKLRFEALGVSASGAHDGKLEQKLLQAVSDLRISEEERKKYADALTGISEAVIVYLKSPAGKNAESRSSLEAQVRRAGELLGSAPAAAVPAAPAAATLNDGMVIRVNEELSLVVANIGEKHGVKTGMPFQILRNDHIIGAVRVVDVRERITGAVIQELTSDKDKIKVGDRLKVAASQ
jgi:hypothetical protein